MAEMAFIVNLFNHAKSIDWQKQHAGNVAKIAPEKRAKAVAFLRKELQPVAADIRGRIETDPQEWWTPYHHDWLMNVATFCAPTDSAKATWASITSTASRWGLVELAVAEQKPDDRADKLKTARTENVKLRARYRFLADELDKSPKLCAEGRGLIKLQERETASKELERLQASQTKPSKTTSATLASFRQKPQTPPEVASGQLILPVPALLPNAFPSGLKLIPHMTLTSTAQFALF
jgi:hypothetical protein